MNITQLFDFANLFVLPFWGLMILLPNWGVTQKVMKSYLPFLVLAGVYIYYFINSVNAIPSDSTGALLNPQLSDIARFFSNEAVAAAGWAHFLTLDLFLGRWIYWQGQETGIFTVHSLILCLFAGPIGLLSHILTVWMTLLFFTSKNQETASDPTTSEA
ncbi:conserved hypothetical protein [Gloeothece citriformis PCC 7424]|uniref:DUF4281 domain-containing protein n=1 Tax=Gloeothece citriformis (strain PCC 7424) TaxID=65393 RepID=B7KEM3_GLOC7|nr:ABA4-like family protein [Gloeothece citriformis]ACK69048.1 conserved hypothetical protein [Gloeothece citriformis PCC 7424]